MKSDLKRKKKILNILLVVFLSFFGFVILSISLITYLFLRAGHREDYCQKVAQKELGNEKWSSRLVDPPAGWQRGGTQGKIYIGFYKQLKCEEKIGLFDRIPQN